MVDLFAFFVVLFLCFIVDSIFFPVICSFQDVSGWKLRKIVRDLLQAQKGNSYLSKRKFLSFNLFLSVESRRFYSNKKNGFIEIGGKITMRTPIALRWLKLLKKASGFSVNGKYLKSIKYAKKVLEINPQASQAHRIIGDAFELLGYEEEDNGNYNQAEDYHKKATLSWDEAKKIDPDISIPTYHNYLLEE